MTEQERYKRAFSALHTSDGFQVNLNEEKKPSHAFRPRRFVTAACVAMAVMAGATAAYAADVGGIQRIVQVWFNGEMTSATLNVDESEGSYKLQDSSGSVIQEGGGVAYDENGNERPLTAEEIQESIEDTASAEIIDGRMSKFSGEVSLYGQVFVKDSKQKVSAFLQANKAEVTSFIRFEVGEGIEKNTVDFAEEVKAQMAAAQK